MLCTTDSLVSALGFLPKESGAQSPGKHGKPDSLNRQVEGLVAAKTATYVCTTQAFRFVSRAASDKHSFLGILVNVTEEVPSFTGACLVPFHQPS
jgi:hypothetical protein